MIKEEVLSGAKLFLEAFKPVSHFSVFIGVNPIKTFKADVALIYRKEVENTSDEIYGTWFALKKLKAEYNLKEISLKAVVGERLFEFRESILENNDLRELEKLMGEGR